MTRHDMNQLVNHARRELAYLRTMRARYATPERWGSIQRDRISQAASTHRDFSIVDHSQARLAARWAVADARRDVAADRADRLDQQLRDREVDMQRLEAERDDAYREGRERAEQAQRHETGPSAATAVTGAAALMVSASLYANALTWDEADAEQVAADLDGWQDPVPETDTVPTESTDASSTGTLDAGEDAAVPESAELPEGIFPYSIEEQLAHVQKHGSSLISDAETGITAGAEASPEVGSDTGIDI